MTEPQVPTVEEAEAVKRIRAECLAVFGSTWSNDVALRFVRAARLSHAPGGWRDIASAPKGTLRDDGPTILGQWGNGHTAPVRWHWDSGWALVSGLPVGEPKRWKPAAPQPATPVEPGSIPEPELGLILHMEAAANKADPVTAHLLRCGAEALTRAMQSHRNSEPGAKPQSEVCGTCGGRKTVRIPCPDSKPGCLVIHHGPCPDCSEPHPAAWPNGSLPPGTTVHSLRTPAAPTRAVSNAAPSVTPLQAPASAESEGVVYHRGYSDFKRAICDGLVQVIIERAPMIVRDLVMVAEARQTPMLSKASAEPDAAVVERAWQTHCKTLGPRGEEWFRPSFDAGYRAAIAALDSPAAAPDVERIVRATIMRMGGDPDEPISDAGHTVLDGIAHDVRRALAGDAPSAEGEGT